MTKINLLPKDSIIEKYKPWFIIVSALIVVSISLYFLLPPLKIWERLFAKQYSPVHNTTEQLPKYSVHKLNMVGYLNQGDLDASTECWSILQTPTGEILTVKIGDYLGYEAAKVADIKPSTTYLHLPDVNQPILIRMVRPTHV